MKQEILKRLKSKVVWASVIAQIAILTAIFIPSESETIKIVGTAVLEIVSLFGIVNNPSDSENF